MKKLLIPAICMCLMFTACGKKEPVVQADAPVEQEEVVPEIEEEPEPVIEEVEEVVEVIDPLEGKAKSPFTGEYIDEELISLRPYAITINNNHKALPQSGIAQADIMYEVPAEGEITRMVGIFQNFDAEKIGPVRSARDYFTYFALDNDAIYIHHGGSPTGYAAIKNRGINDIDGMKDSAFWRDQKRFNTAGMYEHSSYIDAEGIKESAANKGFDLEYDAEPMFSFYDEETKIEGERAPLVTIPYSYYQVSQFVFNVETGLYERYQTDKPQIDDQTGETVTAKNVIIQEAEIYIIPGDDAGRREVSLVGSGKGYMATMGNVQPITWQKTAYNAPTQWFDADGNELKLNAGKTWICVCPIGEDYTFE